MDEETISPGIDKTIIVDNRVLRCGYTTGACAQAASAAALRILLGEESPRTAMITLPNGERAMLLIEVVRTGTNAVTCAVVKDGGDDPDATHGMKIHSTVSLKTEPGIDIDGGEGIGRVTKEGLSVSVGLAAINPAPRAAIKRELQKILDSGFSDRTDSGQSISGISGVRVVISAPEGVERSKKTFNESLGILGGISILGTTGIVMPMSEDAMNKSIELSVRVKAAEGRRLLIASPGNYAQHYLKMNLDVDASDSIKCGNYIAGCLDEAASCGIEGVLLVGHLGKLVKIAAGILNTHSRYGDARMYVLAAQAAAKGAGSAIVRKILSQAAVEGAVDILLKNDLLGTVMKAVAGDIMRNLRARLPDEFDLEMIIFTNKHGLIFETPHAESLLSEIRLEAQKIDEKNKSTKK